MPISRKFAASALCFAVAGGATFMSSRSQNSYNDRMMECVGELNKPVKECRDILGENDGTSDLDATVFVGFFAGALILGSSLVENAQRQEYDAPTTHHLSNQSPAENPNQLEDYSI